MEFLECKLLMSDGEYAFIVLHSFLTLAESGSTRETWAALTKTATLESLAG